MSAASSYSSSTRAEPQRYPQRELDRLALALADAESERIAARLHDTVCQSLSAVQFIAGLAARQLRREESPVAAQLGDIVQQLDAATAELQDLMADLRPGGVENASGLGPVLEEIAARFARKTACELRCPPALRLRDAGLATEICRIAHCAFACAALRDPERIEASVSAEDNHFVLKVSCRGTLANGKAARENECRRETLSRRVGVLGGTCDFEETPAGEFTFRCRIPAL